MDNFRAESLARKDAGSPAPGEESAAVPSITVATPSNDHEKGLNEDCTAQNLTNTPLAVAAPVSESTSGRDHLSHFRYHLGIHQHPDLAIRDGRAAPNLGVYQRVVKAEKNTKKQYNVYNWLINGALFLQIVFAAALTALGAGNGPRSAVTAFGAMNTILAGILTFLKGSGLPNRLKYYQNEWSKVREYIEQRERDFVAPRTNDTALDLNLNKEIAAIEHMYENVRRDVEANQPDSYVSLTSSPRTGGPAEAVTTLSRARDRMSQLEETAQKYGPRLVHMGEEARAKWNEYNKEATSKVSRLEKDVEKGMEDARFA